MPNKVLSIFWCSSQKKSVKIPNTCVPKEQKSYRQQEGVQLSGGSLTLAEDLKNSKHNQSIRS